jgi:hypothetical protein
MIKSLYETHPAAEELKRSVDFYQNVRGLIFFRIYFDAGSKRKTGIGRNCQ